MYSLWIPLPFLLWATYTDVKTRKIRNYTTYPLAVIGLAYQLFDKGMEGLLIYGGAIFAILLILHLLKGMKVGGGDIKLLIACSTFLNYRDAVAFMLITLLYSIISTFIVYIRKRGFKNLVQTLYHEILTGGTITQEYDSLAGGPLILLSFLSIQAVKML